MRGVVPTTKDEDKVQTDILNRKPLPK
jgi:hypothetical protein